MTTYLLLRDDFDALQIRDTNLKKYIFNAIRYLHVLNFDITFEQVVIFIVSVTHVESFEGIWSNARTTFSENYHLIQDLITLMTFIQ